MHFTKALVSLFALASLTTATLSPRDYDEPQEDLAARQYEESLDKYLAARHEFVEARDVFRRGAGLSKPGGKGKGICRGAKKPYLCQSPATGADGRTSWFPCPSRTCSKWASVGSSCSC